MFGSGFVSSLFTQKKCFGCQKSGHFFCPQCCTNISIYQTYCYVCKKHSEDFFVHNACRKQLPLTQIIVLTRYHQGGVKKLLKHAKYYGKFSAYEDLVLHHEDFFHRHVDSGKGVFIPVPMSFFRRWKRGYNQADNIAKNLSKICNIPIERNLIRRSWFSLQQSHLSAEKRRSNLRGVFFIKKKNIVDKNCTIYLVDDIISTGSTVLEIANTLRENGYIDIRAVILASN